MSELQGPLDGADETSLSRVGRVLSLSAALAALVFLAWDLIALEFRLGPRNGVRAVAVLLAPLLAGFYLHAIRGGALRRVRSLPAAVRLGTATAAGALAMASIHFFLVFYPIPVAELVVASCIAALAFGSGSIPGLGRPLAPFGIAAGMLAWVALFGVPSILAS